MHQSDQGQVATKVPVNQLKPGLKLIITSLQCAIWHNGSEVFSFTKKKKRERGNVCLEIGHEQVYDMSN